MRSTMADLPIDDLNVASNETLITPEQLKQEIPLTAAALKTVSEGREVVRNILDGKDHRLFVVVGPCSIHDIKAAHDYAERLKALAAEVSDTLYLVMRVYFEKPRTTVGWKGLINDPYLDDSFKIQDGLHIGRTLLRDLAEMGLPTATEALDPISPQYLQDLISWS
ncbi:MAG TPA: 3-deoxy-7-phosphoheptulonate synthase, partial [Pseudomonas sp.]|nr:3-deoxy-7-phosphoheptulonate synthase [Pseudomonas sp.]